MTPWTKCSWKISVKFISWHYLFIIDHAHKGSLFTLFLHSPLSAFCFVTNIVDIPIFLWDKCLSYIDRFMTEASRLITRCRGVGNLLNLCSLLLTSVVDRRRVDADPDPFVADQDTKFLFWWSGSGQASMWCRFLFRMQILPQVLHMLETYIHSSESPHEMKWKIHFLGIVTDLGQPDPANWCGSDRIQIHKTAVNSRVLPRDATQQLHGLGGVMCLCICASLVLSKYVKTKDDPLLPYLVVSLIP